MTLIDQVLRFVGYHFFFFTGLGSYLATLSPFVRSEAPEEARYIFLAGQVAYPIGQFAAGYLSDRTRRIRALLVPGLLLMIPVHWWLFTPDKPFAALLMAAFFARFLLAANLNWITIALLDAAGSLRFGPIRSAGTVGFALIQGVYWILSEPGFLPFADADYFAFGRGGAMLFLACLPFALAIPSHRKSSDAFDFRQAIAALANPRGVCFLLASFLYFAAFQLIDNYLGAFFDHMGGARLVYSGWLFAVLLEIPYLWFTARIARRLGISALFVIAAVSGALRFMSYALAIMDIQPIPLQVWQLLHGIQFMSYYMGAIYWLRAEFPAHLYGSVYGIYHIAGHLVGGVCGNLFFGSMLDAYPETDAQVFLPVFLIAAGMQAIVIVAFAFIRPPPFDSSS